MVSKPIVAVIGATGQQGGGVVDALLDDEKWAVRAITRDPDSYKAQKLSQRGVEVAKAELADVSSLLEAFKGAYGVFGVTDALGGAASEIQFGKNMVDAAQKAGVKHFVWSGLEDIRQVPGLAEQLEEVEPGRFIPPFESKEEISEHLKASGLGYTIVLTASFYSNWINRFSYAPQGDGSFALVNNLGGQLGIASHDTADVGYVTAIVLGDPDTYLGREVPVVADYLSFDNAVAAVSDVTGKRLRYVAISDEEAANLDSPGAKIMANAWKYCRVGPWWNDRRPLDGCPHKGKSFEEWVQEHKSELAARLQ